MRSKHIDSPVANITISIVIHGFVHAKEPPVWWGPIWGTWYHPKVTGHLKNTYSFPEQWHELVWGNTICGKIGKTELQLSANISDHKDHDLQVYQLSQVFQSLYLDLPSQHTQSVHQWASQAQDWMSSSFRQRAAPHIAEHQISYWFVLWGLQWLFLGIQCGGGYSSCNLSVFFDLAASESYCCATLHSKLVILQQEIGSNE